MDENIPINTVIINNDVINVEQLVEQPITDVIIVENNIITVDLNQPDPVKIIVEGVQGLPGKAGSQIYSGNGIPQNSLGFVGDYYINKSDLVIYGPKLKDGWPTVGTSLNPTQSYANSTFIYDANGNLTRINKTDNTFKILSYNGDGNLITVSDGVRNWNYSYDGNGLLSSITITMV